MKPITACFLSIPVLPVLIWAIFFSDVGSTWIAWSPFAVAAIVTSPILWWTYPTQVHQVPLVFTMAVAMLYGPAACVVTASCYALAAEVVLFLRWKHVSLGVVMVIYDALLYSLAYQWAGGWLGVVLMGLISFLVFSASIERFVYGMAGMFLLCAGMSLVLVNAYPEFHHAFPLIVFVLVSQALCLTAKRLKGGLMPPSHSATSSAP